MQDTYAEPSPCVQLRVTDKTVSRAVVLVVLPQKLGTNASGRIGPDNKKRLLFYLAKVLGNGGKGAGGGVQ